MTPENTKSKRLFSLFLLGCLLFNFPIISLFNHEVFIFGIPVLYFFLFFAWALVIAAMVLTTRTLPKNRLKPGDESISGQNKLEFPNTSSEGPSC